MLRLICKYTKFRRDLIYNEPTGNELTNLNCINIYYLCITKTMAIYAQ